MREPTLFPLEPERESVSAHNARMTALSRGDGFEPLDLDPLPELAARWAAFRAENQHVYDLFSAFALEAYRAGASRIGAKAIWERMRWYHRVEVVTHEEWKLNNSYTAYAARDFLAEHPECAGLFETRRVGGAA